MNGASVFLADEAATEACGAALAQSLLLQAGQQHWLVWLKGTLGAGKTTFSRGLLQALGHKGAVKSPTYTLVEPYELAAGPVFHFDLYRLSDPAELEFIGAREYFDAGFLCLVEWPEKGEGYLPAPDLVLEFHPENGGRRVHMQASSPRAAAVMKAFSVPPK